NGAKGQRWYAWAWLSTASPRHYLLIRRHLATGELAFHYCFVPDGQPVSLSRLVRAPGRPRPVDTVFPARHGDVAPGPAELRLAAPTPRHPVPAPPAPPPGPAPAPLPRPPPDPRAPAPVLPDQPPPADPGMIPLTVPETARLLAHRPRRRRPALAGLAAPPP